LADPEWLVAYQTFEHRAEEAVIGRGFQSWMPQLTDSHRPKHDQLALPTTGHMPKSLFVELLQPSGRRKRRALGFRTAAFTVAVIADVRTGQLMAIKASRKQKP
jgi:hypothetical protein